MNENIEKEAPQKNVLGEELEECSCSPMTGYFRDGSCNTIQADLGSHTVCALLTAEFLEFSAAKGNDLSTPRPEFGFPGLKPNDKWCLCASRWQEAFEAKMAPQVFLRASNEACLEYVRLEDLKTHAIDLS